jgi:outer membrane protein assembly factor BamB
VRRFATLIVGLALASPLAAAPAGHGDPVCSWPMYQHDAGHSGAQNAACAAIKPANVATLRPAWAVLTRDNVSASVAVVDGIVYAGSWDGTFYAIDATSGKTLWTFTVDDANRVAFGRIVSTPAVGEVNVPGVGPVGAVLFGGGGTLYALAPGRVGPKVLAKVAVDPRTEELRVQQAGDPPQIEVESSPVVGHFADGDRIYVGMDVHNDAHVGRTGLLAFGLRSNDAGSTPYRLELLYKFDPETGLVRHSLTEGSGTGWGCGGVWSSPVVDPAANDGNGVVAFGTSNCDNPSESAEAGEIGREAMFGIDATTGEELWRFQPRPVQDVDDDFGSSAQLLPGGAVGEGGKDGWYYARDLVTGTERWSTRAAQAGHLNTGFAVGGFLGTGALGVARDPISGTARPAVFVCSAIPTPIGTPVDEGGNPLDGSLLKDPARLFSLDAIDADTGTILWRSPLALPCYGHVTYANGVVLASVTFGFRIQAFDAGTGLPLWLTPTFGAPSGAPVVVGDMLYFGTGTRETDAEFKAFGDRIQNLASGPLGEHPLSRLSGIFAYRLAP